MFKLYNGAPNGELRRHWDAIARDKATALALGFRITWLPVEAKYYSLSTDYKTLTPDRPSVSAVLADVMSHFATENLL